MLSGAAPGGRLGKQLAAFLDQIKAERAGTEGPAKALLFDATGIADSTELVELQRFFYPAVGRLARSGRVVVLGTPPAEAGSARAHTAQRALEGFTRSLGKEIGGRGATAQLVLVAPGAEDQLDSTLRFLLSPRSAYVSGQVVRIGPGVVPAPKLDWERPLEWKSALVTGASRGIGAAIAATLARDGAAVTGLDVPQAAADLEREMDGIGGESLTLDITAEDAPEQIAERFAERPRRHRPQRRRDQRPDDREDAGRALGAADGDQPLQRGADQRRAAGEGPARRQRPHRLRLLDVGDRRQLGPDELRRLEGGGDRDGRSDGAASSPSAARRSTPSPPASSRRR